MTQVVCRQQVGDLGSVRLGGGCSALSPSTLSRAGSSYTYTQGRLLQRGSVWAGPPMAQSVPQ